MTSSTLNAACVCFCVLYVCVLISVYVYVHGVRGCLTVGWTCLTRVHHNRAICYREASAAQLAAFRAEVQSKGPVSAEMENIFEQLQQPNPERRAANSAASTDPKMLLPWFNHKVCVCHHLCLMIRHTYVTRVSWTRVRLSSDGTRARARGCAAPALWPSRPRLRPRPRQHPRLRRHTHPSRRSAHPSRRNARTRSLRMRKTARPPHAPVPSAQQRVSRPLPRAAFLLLFDNITQRTCLL